MFDNNFLWFSLNTCIASCMHRWTCYIIEGYLRICAQVCEYWVCNRRGLKCNFCVLDIVATSIVYYERNDECDAQIDFRLFIICFDMRVYWLKTAPCCHEYKWQLCSKRNKNNNRIICIFKHEWKIHARAWVLSNEWDNKFPNIFGSEFYIIKKN